MGVQKHMVNISKFPATSEVINGENAYGTIESAILSFQVGGPPGEGMFGFEEDYVKLGKVLVLFLQRLILHCLEQEDFATYRFYLNLQSVYLRGFQVSNYSDLFQPVPASLSCDVEKELSESSDSLVAKFFFQHGFQHVTEIDNAGWSPLCYAALRGDADLVRSLLEEKADPSSQTRKQQATFGVQKGVSALSIAAFFSHNQAVRVLLEAKASLSSGIFPPFHAAATANNVDTQPEIEYLWPLPVAALSLKIWVPVTPDTISHIPSIVWGHTLVLLFSDLCGCFLFFCV